MVPLLRRQVLFASIFLGAILLYLYSPDLPTASPLLPSWQKRWTSRPQKYPVETMASLPTGPPKTIPKIQHQSFHESEAEKTLRLERLSAVKNSFQHSWEGYKKYAWLRDEVAPLSGEYKDNFGGWGASLVDTLDTLWIMGLEREFRQAVKTVKHIDFTKSTLDHVNVFETNIRFLGGLLSAYDVCKGKYPILLHKAIELGETLYHAFDTPTRLPITHWNLEGYVTKRLHFVTY